MTDSTPQPDRPSDPEIGGGPLLLVRELTGDLPCVGCRYNLRGLSVRGSCPECGIPIRATVLAVVDPHAGELRPIRFPALTGAGLVLWSVAGALAALCIWILRASDLATLFELPVPAAGRIEDVSRLLVPALVLAAGVGSLVLVRPHAGIGRRDAWMAAAAALAYVLLAVIAFRIHAVLDVRLGVRYFGVGPRSLERVVLRLAGDGLMVLAALGLRPNLQLLVARSLLLRSGMVDRQTLTGLMGAALVAALGDGMRLLSFFVSEETGAPGAELLRLCGTLLVGLGSLLLTIGLVLLVVDSLRLRPVVVAPPLSYEDVLGNPGRGAP